VHIIALNLGHDGAVVKLEDSNLIYSLEAEKDSTRRFSRLSPASLLDALTYESEMPDVIALGGFFDRNTTYNTSYDMGYHGVGESSYKSITTTIFGKEVPLFCSTHERSHIFCSYGMSPFEQGQECYMLLWEGVIGKFYYLDEKLNIHDLGTCLEAPGTIYEFAYLIADNTGLNESYALSFAGKVMALAAYSKRNESNADEKAFCDQLLNDYTFRETKVADFCNSIFYNCGVESDLFKQVSGKLSDRIFDRFYSFIEKKVTKKIPLLIGGGCGLNCEWNTRFTESGLFSDVFVPPCTNDSGSAIGTAVEAQFHLTQNAKIASWDVYAGKQFLWDTDDLGDYTEKEWGAEKVVDVLRRGEVIAWVSGRYKIGPRALGNRSLTESAWWIA
jgi:hydroxymethyl cephem carbamoyltransferase